MIFMRVQSSIFLILFLFSSVCRAESYGVIGIENVENDAGIYGGFGRLIGNTSKFEWLIHYAPETSYLYELDTDNYRAWSNVFAPELNPINQLELDKIKTSFNWHLGLNSNPELAILFIVGFGYTQFEAKTPSSTSTITRDIADAHSFGYATINYGFSIESVFDSNWSLEVGARMENSLSEITISSGSQSVDLNRINSSLVFISFRNFFSSIY